MYCNSQDLTSYNREQATGIGGFNLVTVVMHEQNYSLTDAMKWISDFNDKLVDTFLSTLKELPSFGDPTLDKDVAMYIDGIANWVRSNDSWSFEVRQIFVDGGVRRASDVMKAVALGANGVGIGRPFLYAYSAYGQEGVEHALQILRVCFLS